MDFIKQQQDLAQKEYWHTQLAPSAYIPELVAQIITNTGEELLRLAEGERPPETTLPPEHLNYKAALLGIRRKNETIDTLKKHITSVTGVERD